MGLEQRLGSLSRCPSPPEDARERAEVSWRRLGSRAPAASAGPGVRLGHWFGAGDRVFGSDSAFPEGGAAYPERWEHTPSRKAEWTADGALPESETPSLALILGSSGCDLGRPGSAGSRGRPAGLPRPRGPARLSKRPRKALRPLRAATPAPTGHSPPRPAPPGPGAALHGSRPPARASVDPPGPRPGLLRRHRRRSPAGGSEPHSHRRPGSDAQVCARAGGAGGQAPGAGRWAGFGGGAGSLEGRDHVVVGGARVGGRARALGSP